MGLSWLAMAFVVWKVLYTKNFHVYITSVGLKEVTEQMERIRFIWYNLPDYIKDGVELGGKGCKDNDSLIEFTNGSAIHAVASSKAAGHGSAPGLYILDEFSRKEGDEMAWRAIKPSLGKNSQVFIISTSNGINNLFAKLWFGATKGENDFTPVFFSCHDHPEYSQEYLDEQKRDFAGDLQGYNEAFPEKPEDAFLASSRSFFDIERVMEYISLCHDDKYLTENNVDMKIGYIDIDRDGNRVFLEDEAGQLVIWKMPVKDRMYCMGTDLAEGLIHGDWSVSVVLDPVENEVVAMFRAKIAPEDYAFPVEQIARFYNNAWLVVEVNKNSELIMQDLKLTYPWLYRRQHREQISDKPTLVPGFYTTPQSRHRILLELRREFSDYEKPLRIYSKIILSEFDKFEVNSKNKAEAASGYHDDCVMALALALEGKTTMPSTRAEAGRAFAGEGLTDMWGRPKPGLNGRRRNWRSL